MSAWTTTLVVFLLALAGAYVGQLLARSRSRWWLLGWAVPLVLVLLSALTRWRPELSFVPPFVWVVAGRAQFAVLAIGGTVMLSTLGPRLPRKRDRMWISVLTAVVLGYALTPFLLHALLADSLRHLETKFTRDGVCRQSNGYTCGPAAAVTALRLLGVSAEEGELALRMYTTPTSGTPVDSLVFALREHYASRGLDIEFRRFSSLDGLEELVGSEPDAPPPRTVAFIAVVKHSFLTDHYVTVLGFTDESVIVGDPLQGRVVLSREAFAARWRGCGVEVEKKAGG